MAEGTPRFEKHGAVKTSARALVGHHGHRSCTSFAPRGSLQQMVNGILMSLLHGHTQPREVTVS